MITDQSRAVCRYDPDGHVHRTGQWVVAYAHIVCAVIGSGVLSLAWGVSWLGGRCLPALALPPFFLDSRVPLHCVFAHAISSMHDTGRHACWCRLRMHARMHALIMPMASHALLPCAGWIAGPIVLFAFAWVTYFCSSLLIDAYRYPDVDGPTVNYKYIDAVERYMGALPTDTPAA